MDFFARTRTRRNMRVFSIVFLVVGGLIGGVYGWFVWDQAANGAEADATVVERVEDEDGATVYVTYTTGGGQSVRALLTGTVVSGQPRYDENLDVGDAIRIRYVPRDLELVRPAAEPPASATPLYFLGFFILLGVALVVFAWWPGVSPGRRAA